MREWIHGRHGEKIKFLISGGVNTGFSLVVYWLLNLWIPYDWAYSLAYIIGIGVSYILQAKWVFREKWSWWHLAFPLVYLVQWAIGVVLLVLLVEKISMNENVAPLVVVVATLPVTFLLSRFVVRYGAGK